MSDTEFSDTTGNAAKSQEVKEFDLSELKKQKRNAKSALTRLLTQLSCVLAESKPNREEICQILVRIDEQREACLIRLDNLEEAYQHSGDKESALKIANESDKVAEQTDMETHAARQFLSSLAGKSLQKEINVPMATGVPNTSEPAWEHSPANKQTLDNNGVHINNPQQEATNENGGIEQQETVPVESTTEQEQTMNVNNENVFADNTTMIQLESSDIQSGQTTTPPSGSVNAFSGAYGHLERIRIPTFAGDKMKYQQWNAAFTSCVDKASLTPQFKMLRLEACLRGEAADTVKGLGYSEEAYNAARARLERKYGGSRRQVQTHLEELKKLRPLQAENAKELELFADVLERAVICLKENNRQSDLQAGTLYTIVLEKIPEKLLSQYYRWFRENQKQESMETLKDWIAQEAEFQIQAAEIKHGFPKVRQDKGDWHSTGRGGRTYHSNRPVDGSDKRNKRCHVCSEFHPIWRCMKYRDQPIEERWNVAKKFGLCYRCLGDNHKGNACKWNKKCKIDGCHDTHHHLLHRSKGSSPEKPGRGEENKLENSFKESGAGLVTEGDSERKTYGATRGQETKFIALRTIPVIVKNGNKKLHVNCLLDEGSDTSYVNDDVVEALGLQGTQTKINVKVANDETISFMSSTFEVGLESMDGRVDTLITAQSSKKICGGMKPVNWIEMKRNWEHLKNIHFPKLARGRTVDILLGADHHELMYSMKEVVGENGQPSARLCPLGWTAMGKIDGVAGTSFYHTRFHHTFRLSVDNLESNHYQADGNLDEMLKKFWDVDSIGIMNKESADLEMSPDEKLAWKKVSESIKFDGQHYEVAVPWREDRPCLPPNGELAKQRLVSTERKLLKDPELAAAYQGVINEYLEKGYIRRVPLDEVKPQCEWLLPHFPVVRPDKSSTKVRIVFDASATSESKSLNTESLPGPKLQSDMVDILVKFRKEPIALVGDISQMYHQLVLRPEDRPMHRFLWRNLDRSKEPEVYEFIRFVFGGCYCPFCAQFTWQKHAEQHKDELPLASRAVKKNCYMDDLMPSVESLSEAIATRQQLTNLGDKANFHIRKWISNHFEVLQDIPEEDRASQINLEKSELPTTKTLGISWTATDDQFSFHYSPPNEGFIYSKRNVLRCTATIFDPLGFLAPFILLAKLMMQQAWVEGLNWDDKLPKQLQQAWEHWFGELTQLNTIKIPRCLRADVKICNQEVHTFSDASEKAYSAVVYIRSEYMDGTITVRMVAAKTRLAPLKAISIPRLELMGAVIGLRLSKHVCRALEFPQQNVLFWIDSMTVGFWIRGQSRTYKPFVAHRVGEIHEATNPAQWKYVPTASNPADHGTRGLTVTELKRNELWWNGPEFLRESRDKWPEEKFDEATTAVLEEIRSGQKGNAVCLNVHQQDASEKQWRLNPSRYSKWYRSETNRLELGLSLVRVRAWVHRFIVNCRKVKEERVAGELMSNELQAVEEKIIREAQLEVYAREIAALKAEKPLPAGSNILNLTPIWRDGLLRSNTRLQYSAELTDEVKYPIILPKQHPVTKLIVKYHHESEGHRMGVNFTLNHLREKYHVVHGREMVKKSARECAECKRRFTGKPCTQQMAPLPKLRLELTMKPFVNTAVDFAGPYLTKQGRGKTRTKRYLCLFLCLQTHCCHLEMVWSLETDGFLQALTRMVARRGWPRTMLSDNGTNFIGGHNEIRKLVSQIDKEKVESQTSNKGLDWHWNPPISPHFGGVFERMIQSAKRGIQGIMGNADVTDEELGTVIVGVESLMNSRPLTHVSGDPNDEPVLTPNHFLIGRMGGELAPESVDYTSFNIKKRWRRVQELIRQIWRRWMKEYLTSLGSRSKWLRKKKNVKPGDVVLVIDPGTPRRQWKLGKIEAVYPGLDGNVRVVDVKEGSKLYRRSIGRISPLEFED